MRQFFRDNPQALVLLIICLVLGLGTFLIVIFGIISAHSGTSTGEPSGSIGVLHAAAHGAVTHAAAAHGAVTRAAAAHAAATHGIAAVPV